MLCRQPETVALVTRACRELGVDLQHCSSAKAALEEFNCQRFQGVIVDDQDSQGAAALLKDIQESTPAGRRALVIALARTDAALDAVFGAGTHLVIYKPLTHDRVRNGLRAIRTLMGGRRQRLSPRVKLDLEATLAINETDAIPVKILDLSRGGAALQVQRTPPTIKSLKLSFALPGEKTTTAAAQLVWRDARGNLGIEFVNREPEFTLLVSKWTKDNATAKPTLTATD
jgi:response regulator RpfG family c-di-GMP phosphodiesterase